MQFIETEFGATLAETFRFKCFQLVKRRLRDPTAKDHFSIFDGEINVGVQI